MAYAGSRRRAAWMLLLSVALAACSTGEPTEPAVAGSEPKAAKVAVVIADIGPGTNPYHALFRRPEWTRHPSKVIPGFPADVPALPLTLGEDYAAALAADAALWAQLQPRQLYWVPGTNLLLYVANAFDPATGIPLGRTSADGVHGSATSAVVAQTCPDCYVLVVQDAEGLSAQFLATLPQQMPWVDLVTQTNFPGDEIDSAEFYTSAPMARATRALEASGRQYFAGAGNGVVVTASDVLRPLPVHNYDLPPWVVNVGGVYRRYVYEYTGEAFETCHLIEHFSGKPPEFVGNWQHVTAAPSGVHELAFVGGTSFATPEVAGRFGQTLLELRRSLGDDRAPGALWAGLPVPGSAALADGRLTPAELRAAMAAGAEYFATASADADCLSTLLALGRVVAPASPTPWLEMGWGYATADAGARALQALLGVAPPPAKPAEAQAFMSAQMAARGAAYAAYPPAD